MIVLLVGNYPFDGSVSMQIWARALERELLALGVDVRLIFPRPVLGRLKPSASGIGKWLGYFDRYLLFPPLLARAAASADVVHMCDHGSAMYCLMVKGKPTVVTCNDMLAVRGALGELPEMRASRLGRYFQRWICSGLNKATRVACISEATCQDAKRLLARNDHLCIVRNGLNYPFQPLPAAEADRRLAPFLSPQRSFLLHVGGGHARKNRDGVLRVFAQVANRADVQLVFAGEALPDALLRHAHELGVRHRIIQIVHPNVTVIEALYNRAVALIFPSRYEGFGWPVIEAQACACPVVASDIPPFREVLGDTAPLHGLDDELGMADSTLKIVEDGAYRQHLKEEGLKNVKSRFQTARMMDEYLALYQELISADTAE